MMRRRGILATLGASVAVAVVAVAATVTPTAAQDPAPVREQMSCTTDAQGYCTLPVNAKHVQVTPKTRAKPWFLNVTQDAPLMLRATHHDGTPRANVRIYFYATYVEAAPEPPPPTTTTTTTATTAPPPDPPPAGCALPSFPDATCTGVPPGTQLEVVNGNPTYSTPGQVVEGKDIRGCVNVKAPGVVIRNSKISGDCYYLVNYYQVPGEWLRIEDSTLVCTGNGGTAVGEERVTAVRLDISGCENGFDINHSALIQDSYVHDLYQGGNGDDPHSDVIQPVHGAFDLTVRHNHMDAGRLGTSAIIMPPPAASGAVVKDLLVRDNLMVGGAYTLYCAQNSTGVNVQVISNRFGTRWYPTGGAGGPWTDCEDEDVVSDNRWYDGPKAGQLLPGHP